MLRIQCVDEPGPTRLPLSEGTHWDGTTSVLRHCAEEETAGVLPYLAPLCLPGICHSSVSCVSYPGQVSQCMTKIARYVMKGKHALRNNWLRDEKKNDFKAGLHFLLATQPSAAQMLNLLSNGSAFNMSCCRKDFAVPAPDEDGSSAAVQLFKCYLGDTVSSQSMTFEMYLRIFNNKVRPPRRYRKI